MGIKANRTYCATVQPGSCFITSQSGTVGFQILLETEDGDQCYRTIWINEKTRKQAERELTEVLGVKKENLTNGTYVENQLAVDIAGKAVSFDTAENEYNGKTTVVVKWLNRPSATAAGVSPAKAASIVFGGKAPEPMKDFPSEQGGAGFVASDEDIPFRSKPFPICYTSWHEAMQEMPGIKIGGSILSTGRNGRRKA